MWLGVVHFSCLMISSTANYCTNIHISLPTTIHFKNGMFSPCLSRELHEEIWSRRFFFFLLNFCGIQTKWLKIKAGINDSQYALFWVCWLSPVWYNVDCSSCLNLITININYSTRTCNMKLCKPLLDIWLVTAPSPNTAQSSFLHFSCDFTFLEIKHNMPKMLISFSTLKLFV